MLVSEFITSNVKVFVEALGYPDHIADEVASECLTQFNRGGFGGGMAKIKRLAKGVARESTGLTGLEATMYESLKSAAEISKADTSGAETRVLNRLVKKDKATYDDETKSWQAI
jgi:hypothetical protein